MTARSDGKTIFISNTAYKRLKRHSRMTGDTIKNIVNTITKAQLQ